MFDLQFIHPSNSPEKWLICFISASEEAKVLVLDLKLEVLCYAAKDFTLRCAVSKLVIPALVDQLHSVKNKISHDLLVGYPEVR